LPFIKFLRHFAIEESVLSYKRHCVFLLPRHTDGGQAEANKPAIRTGENNKGIPGRGQDESFDFRLQ
jgi:hypothetical protein